MDYYVSPAGDDRHSGRLAAPAADGRDGPFRSLARAAAALAPGDVCTLRAGVYREVLRPARSGEPGRPIVYRAWPGEAAVLTGAEELQGWRREGGGSWSAAMPWDLEDQNQVFCGDTPLTEARWPHNTGTLLQPVRARAAGGSPTTLTDPALPGSAEDWQGALLWCCGGARWICWAGRVTGFDPQSHTLSFDYPGAGDRWYTPVEGSEYVLMGARAALAAAGEWWYDRAEQRLHLIPPGGADPSTLAVAAKRRLHALDLSGCRHLHLVGLRFGTGGLLTDADSADLVLDGLRGEYVGHSFARDISGTAGVLVRGRRHTVRHCELAWSSGSVLSLQGEAHRVINCYIHHGNYAGLWSGTVAASGRRHLISHNTFRHSGRDLLSVHGLTESVVQYNDLAEAGWLTHDLGLTYGHDTDFGNTVFHHNWVHDSHAQGLAMGIYFDHLSHNAIVHSNALWNISGDAIRFNNPGYYDLVYHNTCWRTNTAAGRITSFDHSHRQDLYGARWVNNLLNAPLELPDNAVAQANAAQEDPGYEEPKAGRFALRPDSPVRGKAIPLRGVAPPPAAVAGALPAPAAGPDPGAFPAGQPPWKAGHDFARPPQPEPVWEAPEIAGMNRVRNGCFELGTLDGWTKTGAGRAEVAPGNGWGNGYGRGPVEPTGTSRGELRLGGGIDGVAQLVEGLQPDTAYVLSAWARVEDPAETVAIRAEGYGGLPVEACSNSPQWTRLRIGFVTGPEGRQATVRLLKTTAGAGHARCDNVGLQSAD